MIRFTFDGRCYRGYEGDTLASALLANGVRLLGRSFKYHRPRGLLAAGSEEPNALMEIDRGDGRRTPNLRATQIEIYDGLVARSQNRTPSLRWDIGAINDLLAPLLPAGFYYKTFMGPHGAWHRVYEPLIRRAAGLGRAPDAPDPDHYDSRYAHCDVLVIGAGPAGLAAALAAAGSDARIILCDEQPLLGGTLLADRAATLDGLSAPKWLDRTTGKLHARSNVTVLTRTTAFGWYPDNLIGLAERVTDHLADPDPALPRERLWQVRAKEVVIAAGAIERPLVFPGNDRPGVMLADAARTYATRYKALPARQVVVATSSDTAYRAALDLQASGAHIALVADTRPRADGPLPDAARQAGIHVETGARILGTSGGTRLRSVTVGIGGRRERVRAGLLAMSGGWTPVLNLHSQSRGTLRWDEAAGAFLPAAAAAAERSAGACRGIHALHDALQDGIAAGTDAAQAAGFDPAPLAAPPVTGAAPAAWSPPPRPPRGASRAFADFQNDVTSKDLELATREGFHAIEHVKRYTTTGMATDQGKTSNVNALQIVAAERRAAIPEIGLTTFRPPYTPVTFGALAGHSRGALFDPVRQTPMHAQQSDAVFEDVGLWKRARYFPRSGEDMHQAVLRECRTVRTTVSLFDATTLGKIEVAGPDAATFLDRIYCNALGNLAPGRCRYGLMLGEGGFVMDDGIVARLSPTRFHVTTTTGGAPRVLATMEDYLQTEWPDLKVWLASVTEQWAVLAIQGPKAREVLQPLVENLDLRRPHMSVQTGRIAGVPTRLFRVSFTGELGFEVNVPASHGPALWDEIAARVDAIGGCRYGTEAMHVLRAEKGYIIVGQETDGTVTADDLGLGGMVSTTKPDFVGKRSLARTDLARPGRKQLVGLRSDGPPLDEGAQIVAAAGGAQNNADPTSRVSLGHVTSAYPGSTVGPIALALLENGRARIGETLSVPLMDGVATVRVTAPVFLDPEGTRLHA